MDVGLISIFRRYASGIFVRSWNVAKSSKKTTRSIGFKRLPFFHIFCLAPEEVFQADEVACQMRCANGDSTVASMAFHGCQDILSRSQLLYVDPHPARSNLSDMTNMVLQSWVNMKIDVYIIHIVYIYTCSRKRQLFVLPNYFDHVSSFFRYFHSCLVACC